MISSIPENALTFAFFISADVRSANNPVVRIAGRVPRPNAAINAAEVRGELAILDQTSVE